jgi:predicted nuclease of predicted toxin-antitoxin system
MNFLVDAHLPRRFVFYLRQVGHDAIHTLDLPNANRTSDADIIQMAIQEQRIVITKDADFVDSHLLQGRP